MSYNPPIGFVKKDIELADNIKKLPTLNSFSIEAEKQFPLLLTHEFAKRISWYNPEDPLLLQILPTKHELQKKPGFSTDPLSESIYNQAPGLIKKYHGRVILQLTGACPIHCRYCFRRHIKSNNIPSTLDDWSQAVEIIRNDISIKEVIYSGGDPLMLNSKKLLEISTMLSTIPHVKRLRIHTRTPVASPKRVNLELITGLKNLPLVVTMVIHMNHPAEMDDSVKTTLTAIVEAGIPLYNQSVLLKGVNDNVDTLTALSETLIEARVTPYYLHLLDPVSGAAHFFVDAKKGRELIDKIRLLLPGYAVPLLVMDTPGELSKTPL
ncbi:MAG: EF-P beta-lysylation protein EpmB [Magnetococcales bacterium]|nr:EF-P beta-lysylation protein EpmB [Magnetococcales bacterium]